MVLIEWLGFGVLNKVVLEFLMVFWDESVDYFGVVVESWELWGKCFMFWNLKRMSGYFILVVLVVGKVVKEWEREESGGLVEYVVKILKKLFGEEVVLKLCVFVVMNWGGDCYSWGVYLYVVLGVLGEDYDILVWLVDNCVFFVGEVICKEYLDMVGGVMMSGLWEVIRIIDIMENCGDSMVEVEVLVVV